TAGWIAGAVHMTTTPAAAAWLRERSGQRQGEASTPLTRHAPRPGQPGRGARAVAEARRGGLLVVRQLALADVVRGDNAGAGGLRLEDHRRHLVPDGDLGHGLHALHDVPEDGVLA